MAHEPTLRQFALGGSVVAVVFLALTGSFHLLTGLRGEPPLFKGWFRDHRMECFACRHADEEGIEVCSETYWKLYTILHTDLEGVPKKEIARNLGLHCIEIEDTYHWESERPKAERE